MNSERVNSLHRYISYNLYQYKIETLTDIWFINPSDLYQLIIFV